MKDREQLGRSRRWVVKVGSALLAAADGRGLNEELIASLTEQLAALADDGRELLLVSSGSVAAGMHRLGWTERPRELHELQAVAAVGQSGLVQAYESAFRQHDIAIAQVLLTHDDLANRRRYLNARSALRTLLGHRVVPVINENDTVAVEELRFGDNDTLAAMVVNLVEADLLVILTDQVGLYGNDPRQHPGAALVTEARVDDSRLASMAGEGGSLGRGGMVTKIRAAGIAARSGSPTIIAWGREPDILGRLANGETLGTLLNTEREPIAARKQWLASQLQVRGKLQLDDGAVRVLAKDGRSLLAVGVKGVEGDFQRGEPVVCVAPDGREVARGLVNYGADEARKIMGHSSREIEELLGYIDEPELIHRDNLVLL
ncbi:MAG: glutamate 5-kinase [Gammaproteobacteria bacterium]|nr:MAG: glutamate 5-kinase [Gammaproteobacteria bacterium]